MNDNHQLCVKLLHCGNRNIANPGDCLEKSIFYMPMGLFPLAGKLKENGVDVEIIHLDLEEADNLEEILDFNTLDVVGLDCHWINQGMVVLDTARLIKQIKPGVFIVLGGYTAGFFAGEILKDYPFIDAIIRGDGEVPLVELCNTIKENLTNGNDHRRNFHHIQNFVWKGSNNRIIMNEFSYTASSRDMNRLDFAGISLLRNWQYYRDLCRHWSGFSPINRLPVFFLEIGRGCEYNCSFCGGNFNAQKQLSNRSRLSIRSINSVIASIKKAASHGYSHFFASFEFEGSKEWYIKLFQRIEQEKLVISFGYSSLGLPSKLLVDELSRVFSHVVIEISPETSDLDLRKKNKDPRLFYTNEELERCLHHIAAKPNINVQLYFGYLLPFDTSQTVFNTIRYITKLFLNYSSFTEVIYSNLSTDPCSSIFCQPDKYKVDIMVSKFADYIKHLEDIYIKSRETPFGGMNLFKPRDMTEMEAADIKNKAGLFNKIILYFSQPVLFILNKTGNTNILVRYLEEFDLSVIAEKEFTISRIKDLLLEMCDENNIRDSRITQAMDEAFKKASLKNMNARQMNNVKNNELAIITEDEKNEICSSLQKAKEGIYAEFDI